MKNLSLMIVSLPGTWQRALQKSIAVHPFVEVVEVVSGSLSALQLAREAHPDLLMIDSSIPFDDTIALIQSLKQEIPEMQFIVVTDTTQQRRQVVRAGADYTLSSFDFDSQICAILNQLDGNFSDRTESSVTTIKKDPPRTIL